MSATQFYFEHFGLGLRPDPDIGLADWSNKNRILSQKGAAEPGPYRIQRTPYLREIAECLSPSSPVQRVVFMKSAQVGASELGFNWLGFIMDVSPAPVMMVQPTTELAEKVSKQRISSMIEETPILREIIGPEKSRTSGQTVLLKEFRGGVLSITGANSPVGLRSMPVRFLFCDEVDAYPHDVGGEGDPVALAEKRTQTFARRKIFLNSTPTVKDASRIEIEFGKSDQRRYMVPCPHCGAAQYLKFRQLKWPEDNPRDVRYQCEHCNELIEERFKTQMLAEGFWEAHAAFDGITAGFHISALYSPVGWKSWSEIVSEFLDSKNDAPRLKTWVNTILGETWQEEFAAKIGADELMSRAEDYSPGTAPAPVLVLTAGVDVQPDRVEAVIWGWGQQEEGYAISRHVIHGDPSKDHVWNQLDALLSTPIEHEIAEPMKLDVVLIDSGGTATHEAYQFARQRKSRGWYVCKGQSQRNKPAIGKPTKQDINLKGQSLKSGVDLYPVGTDTIKGTIYGRLKYNEPGPGFLHFHMGLEREFFDQLTSEKQVTRYVKGFPVREWVKKASDRNEVLDCTVYAYAALQLLASRYHRQTFWSQMERRLVLKTQTAQNKPEIAEKKPEKRRFIPPRRGFVSSW